MGDNMKKNVCLLKSAFENVNDAQSRFGLFALRIKRNKSDRISYAAHALRIRPDEDWKDFLSEMRDLYVGLKTPILAEDFEVRPFDGMALDEREAFSIDVNDANINAVYMDFCTAMRDASVEHSAEEIKPNATVIKGSCNNGMECVFISVHSPFSVLKHKFMRGDTDYKRLKEPVLSLTPKHDVAIVGNTMFFLTVAGVQVFLPESVYKKVASEKVECLSKVEWIGGLETLKKASQSGVNPRRFLAYNQECTTYLKEPKVRQKIAKKFGIKYVGGSFDLNDKVDAERFIKVICSRGMSDPFTDGPVEVTGSKNWNR